jgi:YebC/PmpR family DNA-binding regulatory protein
MAGHSKWHSIRHKKGANDKKRGKIFTKHAKLIAIAAKDGGDPDLNPSLRTAIENAKAENVPNDNISRAIAKGSGEGKDGIQMSEVMYEAYGPAGTAMLIEAITDNKNRTVSNVKSIVSKKGANWAEPGSVAYMFEKKGVMNIEFNGDADEAQLELIEIGVEEFDNVEGNEMVVYCNHKDLSSIREKIKQAGYKVLEAKTSFIPNNYVEITALDEAKKIMTLVEAIEEDDDVSEVHSNFDIAEDILSKLE